MTDDGFANIDDFFQTGEALVEVFPASTITGWAGGRKGDPDAERFCMHPGRGYWIDKEVAREWQVLGYVQIGKGDVGPTPDADEAEAIRLAASPRARASS